MNIQRFVNTPAIVGNRIKSVRMLAGYTRKAFSIESGISTATLRAWEEPSSDRHGITEKGAIRLITALDSCGIFCTIEWLMLGIGPSPTLKIVNSATPIVQDEVTWNEEESIFRDIESFKANNPNPVVAIILDGSMLPYYSYGDYVGGSKRSDKDIARLVGLNCIVELKDLTLIRKISLDHQNKYILSALNIEPSVTSLVIQNAEIISAAAIVWHRSREKTKDILV